jgi:hypothetical protein
VLTSRSVVSVLVRFVGRSFSTNSRPALRAASGRPPARQRHGGHRGTGLTLPAAGPKAVTTAPARASLGREPTRDHTDPSATIDTMRASGERHHPCCHRLAGPRLDWPCSPSRPCRAQPSGCPRAALSSRPRTSRSTDVDAKAAWAGRDRLGRRARPEHGRPGRRRHWRGQRLERRRRPSSAGGWRRRAAGPGRPSAEHRQHRSSR